jgi:endonuclease YncB( thermonuclease family)
MPTAATTYEYSATVSRVVDGDTVHMALTKNFSLNIDFGFFIKDTVVLQKSADLDFRLAGINAPEMHGATAAAGLAAKNELTRLLGLGPLRVVTGKADKYGRWLATIYVTVADGTELCVNDAMIKGGFAQPYMTA